MVEVVYSVVYSVELSVLAVTVVSVGLVAEVSSVLVVVVVHSSP
jgi:hypothetical protein